eukprot:4522745-Prymnesium_polylepis.1
MPECRCLNKIGLSPRNSFLSPFGRPGGGEALAPDPRNPNPPRFLTQHDAHNNRKVFGHTARLARGQRVPRHDDDDKARGRPATPCHAVHAACAFQRR